MRSYCNNLTVTFTLQKTAGKFERIYIERFSALASRALFSCTAKRSTVTVLNAEISINVRNRLIIAREYIFSGAFSCLSRKIDQSNWSVEFLVTFLRDIKTISYLYVFLEVREKIMCAVEALRAKVSSLLSRGSLTTPIKRASI